MGMFSSITPRMARVDAKASERFREAKQVDLDAKRDQLKARSHSVPLGERNAHEHLRAHDLRAD